MNGQTCARSYDLETGKELWRCAGQTERPCASPRSQRMVWCMSAAVIADHSSEHSGWMVRATLRAATKSSGRLIMTLRISPHCCFLPDAFIPQRQEWATVMCGCSYRKTLLHGSQNTGARCDLRLASRGGWSCLPDIASRHDGGDF